MATTSVMGGAVRRREDPALIKGHGVFVDDLQPTGLTHVAFVRSPMARAKITSLDTSAAKSMPGVLRRLHPRRRRTSRAIAGTGSHWETAAAAGGRRGQPRRRGCGDGRGRESLSGSGCRRRRRRRLRRPSCRDRHQAGGFGRGSRSTTSSTPTCFTHGPITDTGKPSV